MVVQNLGSKSLFTSLMVSFVVSQKFGTKTHNFPRSINSSKQKPQNEELIWWFSGIQFIWLESICLENA
jgi:hypothetical protein